MSSYLLGKQFDPEHWLPSTSFWINLLMGTTTSSFFCQINLSFTNPEIYKSKPYDTTFHSRAFLTMYSLRIDSLKPLKNTLNNLISEQLQPHHNTSTSLKSGFCCFQHSINLVVCILLYFFSAFWIHWFQPPSNIACLSSWKFHHNFCTSVFQVK